MAPHCAVWVVLFPETVTVFACAVDRAELDIIIAKESDFSVFFIFNAYI